MTGVQGTDHLPRGDVERGEEAARAVALVVVRRPGRGAGEQGGDESRTVQGLYLGILVHAEDEGPFRGVQTSGVRVIVFLSAPQARDAHSLELLTSRLQALGREVADLSV